MSWGVSQGQLKSNSLVSLLSLTDIKYQTAKSNQAADILSHHPRSIENNSSKNISEEYETISYTVVCDALSEIIKSEELPLDVKGEIHYEITEQDQLPENDKIHVHSEMVDILHRVTPAMMKEAQKEDNDISKKIHYVKLGKKPTLVQI